MVTKTAEFYVTFSRDVACQRLWKSTNVSSCYSNI